MSWRESSNSNEAGKRTGTSTITFALACTAAAFVASGAAYGAKPKPLPDINDKVCKNIGGSWTPHTCTIPETNAGIASSDFKIGKGNKLDVKGSLTINPGVTIDNDGTIVVENQTGVSSAPFDADVWGAGILVLGTLDNSGAITIANTVANTEGITVSVSYTPNGPSDPSPYTVFPGTLSNSGTITIQNQDQTRGLKNLGTLVNSASGTITVANSGTVSIGVYNRRDDYLVPSYFYVRGTLTNAGTMTISNSGKSVGGQYGYGVYNGADITTTGKFTINASAAGPEDDDAGGLYNSGSFTNYGTLTNNRGTGESAYAGAQIGSFNNEGAMINFGTTYVGTADAPGTGTFVNWEGRSMMINLGKIISYGGLGDLSYSQTMVNYGTIYNYGAIGGGENFGICIEEPGSIPGSC